MSHLTLVYFIQVETSGPLKIGFSEAVFERLAHLQVGNPKELTVYGVIPGSVATETLLHRLLAEHRIRGEWFKAFCVPVISGLIRTGNLVLGDRVHRVCRAGLGVFRPQRYNDLPEYYWPTRREELRADWRSKGALMRRY